MSNPDTVTVHEAYIYGEKRNDELIVDPVVQKKQNDPVAADSNNDNINGKKKNNLFKPWWCKVLIIVFILFIILITILFVTWIGPSYVWGKEKSPTPSPTFCDSTYISDETCKVTGKAIEDCNDVQDGIKYKYDLNTTGCSTVTVSSCSQITPCFNDTHYYKDTNWYTKDIMYQGVFTPNDIGDTITCQLIRNCDDDSCIKCNKSIIIYNIKISLIIVIISTILMFI